MFRNSIITLTLALFFAACTHDSGSRSTSSQTLLIPDWQNNVVHRIALDGAYEGDFVAADVRTNPDVARGLWVSPYVALFLADGTPSVWLFADRAAGAWNGSGQPQKTLVDDTVKMETPICAVHASETVIAVSPDMKKAIVFSRDGELVTSFGYPELYQANDCKLGPDGLLYVGSRLTNAHPGLVSIWDPTVTAPDAKPLKYLVPGNASGDDTYWVHGIVFDDDDNIILTEFSRGRVERWDTKRNERIEVLLDSDEAGVYLKLERGPDGMIYLAGPKGLYRFPAGAHAADLATLQPFFDAKQVEGRYEKPFSPTGITFVPTSVLGAPQGSRNG